MRHGTPIALLTAGTLVVALGCTKADDKAAATTDTTATAQAPVDSTATVQKTLYERLGGEPAIKAVIHSFVQKAATDPKVNFTRKGHPNVWKATPEHVATLETRLVEFVGSNTGGPQKYQGKDMPTAHKGMQITSAEFDALAADLSATLDEFKVPKAEKDELLAVVGSTKDSIVGK